MWGSLLFTGTSALLAGGLVVPAARRLMLGAVDHDWLADELELDSIEPDGLTVRLKDGVLFRVFRLRGSNFNAKVETQQVQMLKGRAALLHLLGELGLTIRLFGVKRRRELRFEARWPSPALAEIGAAERGLFQSSYHIEWYLVLSARSLRPLHEGQGKVMAMGMDYAPRVLGLAEDPDAPCELTGFLNFLVSGDLRQDLPAVSRAISGNLPAADLSIDRRSGLITARLPSRQLHRVMAVRQWPEAVSGRLVGELLALHGDVEVAQLCEPWGREEALMLLKRKKQAQETGLIGNPAVAAECEATMQLLAEGHTTLFHTQFQIILRAPDEAALDALTEAAGERLGKRRVLYSVETEAAALCWFDRLPRRTSRRPGMSSLLRPLTLREENIAALWAFPHSATGMTEGPYGAAPVRLFRTPSGQAYALQLHVSEKPKSRGNYLVFAPTGGGKSTLMMHILGGLAKFEGVRSYIFDSKEGARFMVEALGGVYQGYDDLALNPLDVGEDTPTNRHRIYSILKAMVAGRGEGDDDDAAFAHAVELAFTVQPPERSLNTIYPFAFEKQTALRKAFARWVVDEKGNRGLNSHIFNAPHDSLGGFLDRSHMVGINMNEALDDPVVGPPVVAHIASAIYRAAGHAKGFTIFIDEAAKLLQNDGFRNLAMEMFREYRKLNGSVGLAFQDPAALFKSPGADAFIENTSTFLFLPNSQASEASLRPFKLNDEQIAFVCGDGEERRPGERRALVIKRDAASGFDESAIIDVDLRPLGAALRFYQAGPDANRRLAALQAQWGAAWPDHL
ncbi:hypothetical protein JCM17960_34980 [Magnetospira thiophila]